MNYELSKEQKIKSFTDLNVWKEGHKLVIMIYKTTKNFPKDEIFGLTNQIRRAVVSITSNIAEGFSRNTFKDKAQFYSIALGSLTEVQNQLLVSRDVGYIDNKIFQEIGGQTVIVSKLCNGLLKSNRLKHNS
ncbi:MAG: four helix bundle protein [Candidatus Paceibacterota bacterium]|jgi:four helix bundle protein